MALIRTKQVVHTLDDGTFDTYVPTQSRENYRIVVIASNPAGQANWKDNTASWYWSNGQEVQPAVEDYVASLLLDLVDHRDIFEVKGAKPLTGQQVETRLLEMWFNEMKTVRKPGNRMPRIIDFKKI